MTQYFDDLAVGQRFGSGRRVVTEAEIKAFAAEYDPQPFHLDDIAAKATMFGGLAASGWHTAAMTMRLLVTGEFRPFGGILGGGGDEIRWTLPVRPGDELHVESEILELRLSKSKPELGVVKVRTTTFNQRDEPVQVFIANILVPRRGARS